MTVSLADAAAQITFVGRPVLFLDTCCLLDVVRAPTRRDVRVDLVDEAARISKDSGTHVWVVVAELVMQEFEENINAVKKEVETAIKGVDQQNARLAAVSDAVDPVSRMGRPQEFAGRRLHDRLEDLVRSLFRTAVVLASDGECNQRAGARVVRRIPPAAKGQQFKDCFIVEHYLELCARLRERGLAQPAVLVSSNKKDYCGGDGKLDPGLAGEFGAVGLQYAADLCWARALLK